MFTPKLRRVLACAALTSVLSLLPVRGASAEEPRARSERAGRGVIVRVETFSLWEFLLNLLQKASVRIDPNGGS